MSQRASSAAVLVATAVLYGSAHAATPVTMGFAVSPLALDSSRPSPFGCHARLARGRVAAARVEGRRARGGCLGMVAAAKDCWSMSGANSAMQTLMGMGAGVSTEDVCTFRHDDQGTGIELWHGSFGWFDFMIYDGAPVILSDTWGIQMERPSQLFPSGGQQYSALRQAAKRDECQTLRTPDDTVKAGTWSVTVQGDYIIIKNQYASRQSLVLTDDGFVFIGSRGTSLAVSKGRKAEEIPTVEALKIVPGLQLK